MRSRYATLVIFPIIAQAVPVQDLAGMLDGGALPVEEEYKKPASSSVQAMENNIIQLPPAQSPSSVAIPENLPNPFGDPIPSVSGIHLNATPATISSSSSQVNPFFPGETPQSPDVDTFPHHNATPATSQSQFIPFFPEIPSSSAAAAPGLPITTWPHEPAPTPPLSPIASATPVPNPPIWPTPLPSAPVPQPPVSNVPTPEPPLWEPPVTNIPPNPVPETTILAPILPPPPPPPAVTPAPTSTIYSAVNCSTEMANATSWGPQVGAAITYPGVVIIMTGNATCETASPPAGSGNATASGPKDIFTGAASREVGPDRLSWSLVGAVFALMGIVA
ncbi:hypothetical protein BU24DRAFT_417579 [Aaosphaeria arxii CBS 175.79]|uniref:Uncharacterized protein n=1 Tax=Aaosphaeria arxii CBS 175.79 TaxID=1450172 RepID=A0A6A5YB58_9PLEO|nr:uncharacterized protein BU24DRAFT_417579 [Aaosphaeria arxii CBS 175.79]KAF2021931.1 hypothetical protein BU24DRAFT_417579 [Aaosphaeria arxii CBS 175.79]